MAEKNYDVALSFAGEQRPYVAEVARNLDAAGLRVFYDEYEAVALWGKDLYSHLDHIYRQQSRYCILFLSADYAAKVWTNHERVSAQARALEEHEEYVLPARFDDTQIEGLRPTIGYISLAGIDPATFADMVVRKVGGGATKPRLPDSFGEYLYGVKCLTEPYIGMFEESELDRPPEGFPDDGPVIASPGNSEHWIAQARYLYKQVVGMTPDERKVIGAFLQNGCPGELPELVHIDPIYLCRLTGMTESEVHSCLSSVRHLGFKATKRRFAHEPDPDEIIDENSYDLTLNWWSAGLPAAEDSTVAAAALMRAAGSVCCDDHALQRVVDADFMGAA